MKTNMGMWQRAILWLALLCCVMSILLSGCASPGQTPAEVDRMHKHAWKTEIQQLQDDVDAFWMWDRPSRVSDKFTR